MDGCRRRSTPPSVRFLGRRVYLGVMVILFTALQNGLTEKRRRELVDRLGVPPQTPELGPPSEWLPEVWGADTELERIEADEATVAALLRHYNRVARTLAFEPQNYGPVLEVDENTGEVFWKAWIRGFARAMRLHRGAWERIEGSAELDVIEAVEVIRTLVAAANGVSKLAEEGIELLESMAPTLIGGMVRDLNARKKFRGVSAGERLVPDPPRARVGEDENHAPCGCGSGRQYSRCCGAH